MTLVVTRRQTAEHDAGRDGWQGAGRAGMPVLLLLLAGCTGWPPPGSGGMAELRPPVDRPGRPPADEALGRRMACALASFEATAQAAAEGGVLAGQVALVRRTAIRAQREFAGGLRGDAARSLDALEAEAAGIRLALPADAPPVSQPHCTGEGA